MTSSYGSAKGMKDRCEVAKEAMNTERMGAALVVWLNCRNEITNTAMVDAEAGGQRCVGRNHYCGPLGGFSKQRLCTVMKQGGSGDDSGWTIAFSAGGGWEIIATMARERVG
ncbi:hypothetical protein BHE74_00047491 [Ensete ventricosum]|nr:hypothetical protein BHE74_00047491 [Ensete ventricosum]